MKGYGNKLTLKVKNWIDVGQMYNVEYVPITGKDNVQADLLSRLPHEINAYNTRLKKQRNEGKETMVLDLEEDELKHNIPAAMVDDYDGDVVIACICEQNKEYGIMVQFDTCDRWSHIR